MKFKIKHRRCRHTAGFFWNHIPFSTDTPPVNTYLVKIFETVLQRGAFRQNCLSYVYEWTRTEQNGGKVTYSVIIYTFRHASWVVRELMF